MKGGKNMSKKFLLKILELKIKKIKAEMLKIKTEE